MQRFILFSGILITLVLSATLLLVNTKEDNITQNQPAPIMVKTLLLGKQLPPMIKAYGTLKNNDHAIISAEISGKITNIIPNGSVVTAGKELINIDDGTYSRNLNQAKLNTQSLMKNKNRIIERIQHLKTLQSKNARITDIKTSDFDKQHDLYQKKLLSDQDKNISEEKALLSAINLDNINNEIAELHHQQNLMELQYQQALIAQKQAESQMNKTIIKAPYDGIVTDTFVVKGELAQPNTPLLSLSNPDGMYLETHIPYPYLDRIQSVHSLSAHDEHNHSFTLTNIIPHSANGLSIEAILKPEEPGQFIEGQRLGVWVELPHLQDTFAIPESSLYEDHIYRLQQGRLERIKVHIKGRAYDEEPMVIIASQNLNVNDPILLTRLYNPDDPKLTVTDQSS
ncbi:MAG: efflux RND transporter periplasmic adaptor subunit [Candidatus Comchoanobacterales bacterium]